MNKVKWKALKNMMENEWMNEWKELLEMRMRMKMTLELRRFLSLRVVKSWRQAAFMME